MQTFLPFPSFKKSVAHLDWKRLGKQRVECSQLLDNQWANHPATVMWRGYHDALRSYAQEAVNEWVKRGYQNTLDFAVRRQVVEMPWWFNLSVVHRSHQLRLLEKDHAFYSKCFNLRTPSDPWGYVWPQERGSTTVRLKKQAEGRRLAVQRQVVERAFPHLVSKDRWCLLLDATDRPKAYGLLVRWETGSWYIQSHTTGKDAKPVCYLTEDLV